MNASFETIMCKNECRRDSLKQNMSKRLFHYKSLGLGYYPTLSQMIRSSSFSIFKQKNKWKNIMDGAYGKLVLRYFSFCFSADFSSHSSLKNAWGRFVYEKNQGAECHGNDRIKLIQMHDLILPCQPCVGPRN